MALQSYTGASRDRTESVMFFSRVLWSQKPQKGDDYNKSEHEEDNQGAPETTKTSVSERVPWWSPVHG